MGTLSVPDGVDPDHAAYVENPVTTERFLFHTTPDDPRSDPLGVDIWAAPAMEPLAAHVHADQDETFHVNRGTLALTRDGQRETVQPDETVTVEAGVPHAWHPVGESQLHLSVEFQPGLETEQFLRDLATLAQQGAVRANGAPSLLQIAALYDAYGYDLLHLARPPLPVQTFLFGTLAPVARRLGYEANPVPAGTD